MSLYGAIDLTAWKHIERDGSMTKPGSTRSLYRRKGDAASAGKNLARTHARPVDRRVVDEERLSAASGASVQLACHAHAHWNGVTDFEVGRRTQ